MIIVCKLATTEYGAETFFKVNLFHCSNNVVVFLVFSVNLLKFSLNLWSGCNREIYTI